MTIVAVADTGPLIYLAEIDSLRLLSATDTLYVPRIVYAELEEGGIPGELSSLAYELVNPDDSRVPSTDLDAGETAALAAAAEHDAVLLTDDLAARKAAMEAGIEVHGTLGVIALGYGRGLLERDEAAARMRALQRETSLFVTDAIVERGIDLLDSH